MLRGLRPLLSAAYHMLYRTLLPLRCWLEDRFGKRAVPAGLALPPAKLRFRVGESLDASEFFRIGSQTADNLERVLSMDGCSLGTLGTALDFGCGCGRTLMWLARRFPQVKWHGTDVDGESIAWCRANLPGASFGTNAPLPPLAYEEASVDLLYGISVFTHLNEEYQRAWLSEFYRVLRPGGLLLLTVHNEECWKVLDAAEEIRRSGMVVRRTAKLKGIVPDWYQTTFQTPEHFTKSLAMRFKVIRYVRQGFGYQDAFVAKRV